MKSSRGVQLNASSAGSWQIERAEVFRHLGPLLDSADLQLNRVLVGGSRSPEQSYLAVSGGFADLPQKGDSGGRRAAKPPAKRKYRLIVSLQNSLFTPQIVNARGVN